MTPQEKGRASIERDADDEARSERTKALFHAALGFAALDMPVFPVHTLRDDGRCSCGKLDCQRPGKHPRTARGFKEASTDKDQIDAWWQRWPDAGVAIATGAAGLVVIDVDVKELRRRYGDQGGRQADASRVAAPWGPRSETGHLDRLMR